MTLNVVRRGPADGPVVVLLHGAAGDHRMCTETIIDWTSAVAG